VGFEPTVTLPPQWFSRASVIHCPPLLLPGLSARPACYVIQDHPAYIPRVASATSSSRTSGTPLLGWSKSSVRRMWIVADVRDRGGRSLYFAAVREHQGDEPGPTEPQSRSA
jgi:hypothetical protein